MKTTGLRGRCSPMNDATEEQKATIARLREEAKHDGCFMFEVRYATWIGPGCAAEHGDIVVCIDGGIAAMVTKAGGTY